MAVRELASMLRKGSVDQFSSCTEEDPLGEDSDLSTTEAAKPNAELPCPLLGCWGRLLTVLAALGSAALVGFAVARASGPWLDHGAVERQSSHRMKQHVIVPSCNYTTNDACPALALFHNPEVHEVATENLMKVGHKLLRSVDRDTVKAAVAAGFRNVSFELQIRAPAMAEILSTTEFNKLQKNAVLNSMRLMSNPQVQSIGYDIGQAIHDSKSFDREELRHRIEAKLRPRLSEILKMRSELMPEPLRQMWGGGQQWAMTLDEENVHIMGPYRANAKYLAIRESAYSYMPQELTPFLAKTYSILGGVLEEGRALLNIIELCGHLSRKHLEVPYWVTYLGGTMEVTSELLSCEHHFGNSNQEDMKLNSTSALFCPLKFGTQGMDALKAAFDMDSLGPFIPDTQFASPSMAAHQHHL